MVPAVLTVRVDGVVEVASEAAFLPEPVDHQEPVVDAEADAEHVDDVDAEDADVAEGGGGDEHGEGGDDAGEGDEERQSAGPESAEEEDHGDERDGQGDRLASEEVVLGRGGELLTDEHVPADEDLGCVEVSGDVRDLVRELELGFLVESTGDGDHGEGGSAVAGAQRVDRDGPRVDDGDDPVDGGDLLESLGESCSGDGVVDVDAVGDDGDLPAGLGEVVEAFGDTARLGAGAGAEVGGEHGERRAPDRGRGEEQDDPERDDRTAAAHDERSE